VFEQLNELFRRKRLPDAKLFGRGINAGGTSKHFALQEVVNAAGEDCPVVNQEADDYCSQQK
jgi:hypothetical protein